MDEFTLTKENVFRSTEERKQLRTEFNRASFKEILEREKGKVCICCGSTLGIEYHHILPLCLGGDNRLSNIYPVCNSCHKLIHGGRVNKMWRADNKGGRKKIKAPKGYKEILDRYFCCEIGKTECQGILGYKGAKLNDAWWYKEYMKEKGIVHFRNNIDLLMCQKNRQKIRPHQELGYVEYERGSREYFYSDAYLATHQEYKQEQLSFM